MLKHLSGGKDVVGIAISFESVTDRATRVAIEACDVFWEHRERQLKAFKAGRRSYAHHLHAVDLLLKSHEVKKSGRTIV